MRRVVVTGLGVVSSIGNTAEAILNQIDCSVLAVKPEGFETPVALEEPARVFGRPVEARANPA